ncbi:amidase domain-containing protein [Lutispora saccharofermentans]|uniref:Amidase domain-containing protein n=1 Tax=Lutispora saccharofermentans TaxID=3024236 RepID=A0ABT1NAG5_9FIRM|nr:amidase domain-containing protein [Lutispora saccharofermentans]MCQ1528252.1 amidase domain-containing protein [Lutispora saccharofermentans]
MISDRQNRYNRARAVNYAKTYALSPNPSFKYFKIYENLGGDCTNFISQCLLAGDAPMTYGTEHAWWYNKAGTYNTNDDSWSVPWAVAHSLYWTLKVNNEANANAVKGVEVSSVAMLELGDIIFFEDENGVIFHSTIVTGFSPTSTLVSHHTYDALDVPYTRSWRAKRYHYLKIRI